MQYIVVIVVGKCVWSLVRRIVFGIKNRNRIKRNEKILTTPGRWY